jgi:hypothetical protein
MTGLRYAPTRQASGEGIGDEDGCPSVVDTPACRVVKLYVA